MIMSPLVLDPLQGRCPLTPPGEWQPLGPNIVKCFRIKRNSLYLNKEQNALYQNKEKILIGKTPSLYSEYLLLWILFKRGFTVYKYNLNINEINKYWRRKCSEQNELTRLGYQIKELCMLRDSPYDIFLSRH